MALSSSTLIRSETLREARETAARQAEMVEASCSGCCLKIRDGTARDGESATVVVCRSFEHTRSLMPTQENIDQTWYVLHQGDEQLLNVLKDLAIVGVGL